jgi:hypothetical protein
VGRDYFQSLTDRVAELERIVAGNRRPPSRLANTFRYLVANIEVLERVIEQHKKSTGQQSATS